jgi:hypothetical protein
VHPASHAEAKYSLQPGQGEADGEHADHPLGHIEVPEGHAADTQGGAKQPGEAFGFGGFPDRGHLASDHSAQHTGWAQGCQAEGGRYQHVEDDEGAHVADRIEFRLRQHDEYGDRGEHVEKPCPCPGGGLVDHQAAATGIRLSHGIPGTGEESIVFLRIVHGY